MSVNGPGRAGYPGEVRAYAVTLHESGITDSVKIQQAIDEHFGYPEGEPSSRSIERWIREWKEIDRRIRIRERPFAWERIEVSRVPVEGGDIALAAWKDYQLDRDSRSARGLVDPSQRQLPFTNRLAYWCWRVHESAKSLAICDTVWVAAEYALSEQMRDLFGAASDMPAWSSWLAIHPWVSLRDLSFYLNSVSEELIPPLQPSVALDFFDNPERFSGGLTGSTEDGKTTEALTAWAADTTVVTGQYAWDFSDEGFVPALPVSLRDTVTRSQLYGMPLDRDDGYYQPILAELRELPRYRHLRDVPGHQP